MTDSIISESISLLAQAGSVPIPDYSNFSLPAPAWLLEVLFLVTFWVHMIFVASVIGSALVLFARSWSFFVNREIVSVIDRKMVRAIPPVLSLTITTGIAPLLFVQTLYGHYSYSSNIFLGYFWLGSLALLLVGFICLYFTGWLWRWKVSLPLLVVLPVCFVGIAYIYTNNAVLTIQPEHWVEFHRNISFIHVRDAITVPRFLHNISYSIIIGGLFLVWVARTCSNEFAGSVTGGNSSDCSAVKSTIRCGYLIHVFGLIVLLCCSSWYLNSLPAGFKQALLDDKNMLLFGRLWVGVIILSLIVACIGVVLFSRKILLILSTLLSCSLLGGMVVIREFIRRWYLGRDIAGSFSIENWAVATQFSAIIVFLISFVVALAVIGCVVALLLKSPHK